MFNTKHLYYSLEKINVQSKPVAFYAVNQLTVTHHNLFVPNIKHYYDVQRVQFDDY